MAHRIRVSLALLLALALSVAAGPALAQSATGTISGTVLDTAGQPLPGASVNAKNVKTGATREVKVDVE